MRQMYLEIGIDPDYRFPEHGECKNKACFLQTIILRVQAI